MPSKPKPVDPANLTDAQVAILERAMRFGGLSLPSADHGGSQSHMTRRLAEAGLLHTEDQRTYLATEAGRTAYERSAG